MRVLCAIDVNYVLRHFIHQSYLYLELANSVWGFFFGVQREMIRTTLSALKFDYQVALHVWLVKVHSELQL